MSQFGQNNDLSDNSISRTLKIKDSTFFFFNNGPNNEGIIFLHRKEKLEFYTICIIFLLKKKSLFQSVGKAILSILQNPSCLQIGGVLKLNKGLNQ